MFSTRLKLKFCWWFRNLANQLNQLRLIVYPTIYKVLYIPGGCLGFQPSAVAPENQRLEDEISWGTLLLFRFHVNFPGCKTGVDMNVLCYCDTCTRGTCTYSKPCRMKPNCMIVTWQIQMSSDQNFGICVVYSGWYYLQFYWVDNGPI